jgi:hypothetical protein
MKTYPIPAQLLQDIVDFLQRQPYISVVRLLAGINDVIVATDRPILPSANGKTDSDSIGAQS